MFLFLGFIISTQAAVDWSGLRQDIVQTILPGGSEPFSNNGPFLVRLAWHCAGTYRAKDGRGGCDGARITHMPEYSWRDNAGLPGAQTMLRPLKEKYGDELSWGDLIVFAGSMAIEEMGGPKMDFCGGRTDYTAAEAKMESEIFNNGRPNKHHDLIYVDPGQDGAAEVRETFGDMGFNDQETVAISGGGHAFGGCHASRSGFSGYWTSTPDRWTNDYFVQLLETEYVPHTVPGTRNPQYVDKATGKLMMLKTDISFSTDPEYRKWVEIYANDMDRLTEDFKASWEKLMNRDMGDRPCLGPDYPEPSYEIPAPCNADLSSIADKVKSQDSAMQQKIAKAAFNCASTYRETDHRGGCNGARIAQEPEVSWRINKGISDVLSTLKEWKPESISLSDTIVYAGTVAMEILADVQVTNGFCPGRVDDVDGSRSELLADGPLETGAKGLKDYYAIMGMTPREAVALTKSLGLEGQHKLLTDGDKSDYTQAKSTFEGDEFAVIILKDVSGSAWTKLMNSDRYHGECAQFGGKSVAQGLYFF